MVKPTIFMQPLARIWFDELGEVGIRKTTRDSSQLEMPWKMMGLDELNKIRTRSSAEETCAGKTYCLRVISTLAYETTGSVLAHTCAYGIF